MSNFFRRGKFNNTRSYVVNGEMVDRDTWQEARSKSLEDVYSFHSKSEALRYLELRELAAQGKIERLRLQPRYDLFVQGLKVCTYISDFEYVEQGKLITEDVKGQKTPEYKIKSRLFHILYCSAGHRLFRETKKKRKDGFKIDTFPAPE